MKLMIFGNTSILSNINKKKNYNDFSELDKNKMDFQE